MIMLNEKIKKTYKVFTGVTDVLQKQGIDIDGVIEIFNNGIEQGTLLKIFDKYDPQVDICIWAYLPEEREVNNQMKIIIGHHCDCELNNMWKATIKEVTFTQNKARDLHDEVRKYVVDYITSNFDKIIELRKEDEA